MVKATTKSKAVQAKHGSKPVRDANGRFSTSGTATANVNKRRVGRPRKAASLYSDTDAPFSELPTEAYTSPRVQRNKGYQQQAIVEHRLNVIAFILAFIAAMLVMALLIGALNDLR